MTVRSTSKRLVLFAAVVALAVPLFAATAMQDWGSSPEAYFMTKAERIEWQAIRTDPAAAQAFIDKFRASRGPDFAAMVADRVAKADQYFTIGKTPGSKALRGKVIILLGPPSSLSIVTENDTHVHRESAETASAYSGGGGSGAGGGDNEAHSSSLATTTSVKNFYFTYANPKLEVIVPADPNTGKDLPMKHADKLALEDAFELAAADSIRK
jgi:GWxTD domain-containing protein